MTLPAKGPGRPPGSPNRRQTKFAELIEEYGFDAAEEFVWIYKEAKDKYLSSRQLKALSIALSSASEIASYCFPKLKSVEHVRTNQVAGMTPQEKLDALKEVQKLLELEIKANASR